MMSTKSMDDEHDEDLLAREKNKNGWKNKDVRKKGTTEKNGSLYDSVCVWISIG